MKANFNAETKRYLRYGFLLCTHPTHLGQIDCTQDRNNFNFFGKPF